MTTINPTAVRIPFSFPHGFDVSKVKVVVEGPKSVLAHLDNSRTPSIVEFTTDVVGSYVINLTVGGQHVPLSPITVEVKPKNDPNEKPHLPELPNLHSTVSPSSSNKKLPVKLNVGANSKDGTKIPSTDGVDISISGPETVTSATAERVGEHILIGFETSVRGVFSVSIRYKGQHIQGSPFEARA